MLARKRHAPAPAVRVGSTPSWKTAAVLSMVISLPIQGAVLKLHVSQLLRAGAYHVGRVTPQLPDQLIPVSIPQRVKRMSAASSSTSSLENSSGISKRLVSSSCECNGVEIRVNMLKVSVPQDVLGWTILAPFHFPFQGHRSLRP